MVSEVDSPGVHQTPGVLLAGTASRQLVDFARAVFRLRGRRSLLEAQSNSKTACGSDHDAAHSRWKPL